MAHFKSLLLFLAFSFCLFAQTHPEKNIDYMLRSGIDEIINQNYENADSIFKELNKKYPQNPLGKIYLSAVEIAEAYDLGIDYNSFRIEKYLNEAIEISEELLNKDEENIWNIYYLGLAKGYLAYYEALNEDWLNSFAEGLEAINLFEKCLDKDSSFYEGHTAIGTYKYWRSEKTEFLNWLPFVKDERAEGIENLLMAVHFSSYNSYLAVNSLQWIYIDKKEYKKASEISQDILDKYPNSRFFKWGYARALEEIDKKKSIEIYTLLLESYKSEIKSSGYNEIVLKHLIAQQNEKLGKIDEALKLCNEILSTSISDRNRGKLKDRLERVEEMKKSLEIIH